MDSRDPLGKGGNSLATRRGDEKLGAKCQAAEETGGQSQGRGSWDEGKWSQVPHSSWCDSLLHWAAAASVPKVKSSSGHLLCSQLAAWMGLSRELGLGPASGTDSLRDPGSVTPSLCASVPHLYHEGTSLSLSFSP